MFSAAETLFSNYVYEWEVLIFILIKFHCFTILYSILSVHDFEVLE